VGVFGNLGTGGVFRVFGDYDLFCLAWNGLLYVCMSVCLFTYIFVHLDFGCYR
jgi:hypothetical protein